jgi:N-methylhydantoinase A
VGYRIGIDVGGTFTDFVLVRPGGEVLLWKEPTTLTDQSVGVMRGLECRAQVEGLELHAFLADTDLIVHGTTTADNTMIEMSGASTGLLTTEGHRDEIEIRRGYKEEIWDPAFPPPVPIARRRNRLGIPERLDFRGRVQKPLDEQATRRLRRQGVESIAVCLLFSFVDPSHEKRVREIIEEEYPGVRISLSHEVLPCAPEFERTSTTLVDAYVGPRVQTYLERLECALREAGYARDLLVLQSNGGIMSAGFVAQRAVAALGSGPTGGVMSACALASSASVQDFIAIDMGGTSYEVCLVRGGRPSVRSSWNWQHRYLVGLPTVEIHSIGAGGGSIAHVEAGALRVGPQSAGADPGPICYGRGGTHPTVTDANVVLGYLDPEALCGGEFKLTRAGVSEAIQEQIGAPIGLGLVEAAHGIFRIVNANMTDAIRRVSSQTGLDPRQFALVVYGGNGPVHAGKQAEALGIRRMIVPKTSPAFSALGLLIADYVVDTQRSYITPAGRAEPHRINTLLDDTEAQARRDLGLAGLGASDIEFERYLNVCYPGQTFDMPVPAVHVEGRMGVRELSATIEAFHEMHEQLRGFAARDDALGRTRKPPPARCEAGRGSLDAALRSRRSAFFDGRFVETPVYDGERLGRGQRIEGPAIIEERFTTIVLYPGHTAELDERANYVCEIRPSGGEGHEPPRRTPGAG